jgi:hypothetical protein
VEANFKIVNQAAPILERSPAMDFLRRT